jgi:hypothetical protein
MNGFTWPPSVKVVFGALGRFFFCFKSESPEIRGDTLKCNVSRQNKRRLEWASVGVLAALLSMGAAFG